MGVPDDVLHSALRFSFGPHLADSEVDEAADRICAAIRRMRETE